MRESAWWLKLLALMQADGGMPATNHSPEETTMDTSESTPGPSQFNYPDGMKVYGMIIDDRIPNALVRVGLRALHDVDADLLVFLCLATDDIRDRTEWDELVPEIRFNNGRSDYEVRLVSKHEELMDASLNMRVLRLPEYTLI
jgi:hypothetical protein